MRIGIVGGGAAAVGLLDTLAGTDSARGRITVFDGSSAVWRGRPYQSDLEAVRVNAPPALMSVRVGDQAHYARWLQARNDAASYLDEGLGQPLVPRGVYGEYLEQSALAAIRRLRRAGWQVSVVNARVTGFADDGGTVLHTEDRGAHPLDRVVLCVGSGRPRDHYGLTDALGYVDEPYPLEHTLATVRADAHVAVIGSGLTAVDIAAALTANGHTGPISLLSRGGVLPYVQQRPLPLAPRHLTPANAVRKAEQGTVTFAQLVELMRAELADLGQDFDSFATEIRDTGTEEPVARLRRQLAEVDSPHQGRRLLTMAIRTIGPILWPMLAERDRAMLRTEHFRTVSSLSSPMVPYNARIMLRILDSGQLRLRSGLTKIEARPGGGFTVFDDAEWTADAVFNAVNPPAYTTPQESEPLVSALLAAGAAELAPSGGLRVEPGTRRLLTAGRPSSTWHVLGNLAADSMFIATNPPGLAAEAAAFADHLTC
ncbi:FAD/NAD(P)-binding protein [Nocardia sp. NPDC057440]|uniref:FAD/NAD(P)-binding protein n=1 Tax=Nocardia sp. NPDC057440 TaxID=3346134 RepID=UPI00366C1EAC